MFVLRKARELVAEKRGTPPDRVIPTTPLEAAAEAEEIRLELFAWVVEELSREHIIEGAGHEKWLGLLERDSPGEIVADLAEGVTLAAVRLLVGARLDIDPAELRKEHNFAVDLGADSLTRVDLVLLLEETLEVSVPDDSMFLVQTVGDAELFAALFDRTREEIVVALGEPARELTFDTPLDRYGPEASSVALSVAARALGPEMTLPSCTCRTLKDVVRLAFLTEKLRLAFSRAADVDRGEITSATVPGKDLGLSAEETRAVLTKLATAMDLGAVPLEEGHRLSLAATVGVLADHRPQDGGSLR